MSTYTKKRARLLREYADARRQAIIRDTEGRRRLAIHRLLKAQDELLGLRRRAAQEWVEKKPPATIYFSTST